MCVGECRERDVCGVGRMCVVSVGRRDVCGV